MLRRHCSVQPGTRGKTSALLVTVDLWAEDDRLGSRVWKAQATARYRGKERDLKPPRHDLGKTGNCASGDNSVFLLHEKSSEGEKLQLDLPTLDVAT